jgi:hypothetical protein
MSPRSHAEMEELLGVYALDAVDPDEAEAVARHLEECPRCRAEVSEHRNVAALLANSGGDAPADLWDRIASSLEEAPPPMRVPPAPPAGVVPIADVSRRRQLRSFSARSMAALAVAAAVVIGVLGVQLVRQDRRINEMQTALDQRVGLQEATLQAATLALSDPQAAEAQLVSEDEELSVTAVVMPDGTGYLIVRDLPPLPENRAYQLWGAAGENVVSLGVLGAEPGEVVPFVASAPLDLLVITEEVAGGVPVSAEPPLLAGEVD